MLDVELFFLTISNPMYIGVYQDGKLIEKLELDGHSSELLPSTYEKLQSRYNIKGLYFVNGPGSYMAIKLTHIFLTTINITKNINIYAALGFAFNNDQPIKAMGKKYFIKDKENSIILETFEQPIEQNFFIPEKLDTTLFSKDIKPLYMLPVVN